MLPQADIKLTAPIKKHPERFTSAADRDAIIELLRSVSPAYLVETGVQEGFTAKFMLENVASITKYLGIDVPPGHDTTMPVQRTEVPAKAGHLIASDPRVTIKVLPRGSYDLTPEDIGTCDAMFIDGDHSLAGVANDTALARKCVRPGGIIIWHDYFEGHIGGVKPLLEEMQAAGRNILHATGTWVAFERC